MNPVITRSEQDTLALARALLVASGSPPDLANDVAESLVGANMAGHDSHGIQLLAGYIGMAQKGVVAAATRVSVLKRAGAMAVLDGGWGWGQSAARAATAQAIELARESGVGAVTVQRCHHIGRVGEYVERFARAGMTGVVVCNAGPAVLPYGGAQKRLGTNPIAWAAPGSDPERPLLTDLATSMVAGNKIALAQARGVEAMAPGLFVDAECNPSTRPADFFAGGALLPAAGHKGYALGVMVEFLGGALSGGWVSPLPEKHYGNGPLFLALNIPAFTDAAGFRGQVDAYRQTIASTTPARGHERVQLPGDHEADTRRARAVSGIPIPQPTWAELLALCDALGVAPPGGRA
ncbi:MAG: Ldh family oxidoreductase [Thermoflexales bacterium]|nr:Ldh family oxidoreductase [Thermoflexales bacterium]